MNRKRLALWLIPTSLYLVFALWYTNLSGPLTEAEISAAMQYMASTGSDDEGIARFRRFMEEDTGKQFIMVNIMDMAESPPELPATGPGANASELMNHYMEHMFPALLSRASHPVFMGNAIAPAMDIYGIENAEIWSSNALMRYRSRRDIVAIATDPRFAERHNYKLAALDKTIAYPVEVVLYPMDLRFLLGLIILCLVLLTDLIIFRRTTKI